MSIEALGTPERPKLTLKAALSETSVHALGVKRLNERERKDVEALLSRLGAGIDDPYLICLTEADVADLMEYARTTLLEDKKKLQLAIADALEQAREKYGQQDGE